MKDSITIREGNAEDIPQVFDLIKELAVFEKALHEVENSIEQLLKDGFGTNPLFGLIVAEDQTKIVGISLYYFRYSTWKGKKLYLEDIIVSEKARGTGIGSQLFEATMKKSLELNCNGMTWAVLDWNEPAIKFYEKYKPVFDKEWVMTNLSKQQILENLELK
jgi:GNAT superfamily N-acetyltransferase